MSDAVEVSFLAKKKESLPFKVLVMAPLHGDRVIEAYKAPQEIHLDYFDQVMKKLSPMVNIEIDNQALCQVINVEQQTLMLEYEVNALSDFLPSSIVEREPNLKEISLLIAQLREILQEGEFHFFGHQFNFPHLNIPELNQKQIKRHVLEVLVCELESMLSNVLNDVIHQPNWQQLESSWRGLHWLCCNGATTNGCIVECLSSHRELLWEDLVCSAHLSESELYHILYANSIGQYGAVPYGSVILDEYVSARGQDIELLSKLTEVCAIAHVPLITGTDPKMFDVDGFSQLQENASVSEVHTGPRFIKWRSFINEARASYLALTMPRIRLRGPYVKGKHGLSWFQEDIGYHHESCLWGNACFAFASNLVRSFSENGFCTDISGLSGGTIQFEELLDDRELLPVEVTFSEEKEAELIRLGFNPICARQHQHQLLFQSANSSRWATVYYEPNSQSLDSIASAQFQYLFIVLRIIHCLKIMFRNKIGLLQSAQEVSADLNRWIRQFVADVEYPTKSLQSQRPLRDGKVVVKASSDAGCYDISLELVPHLKYLGTFISCKASVPVMDEGS